MMFERFSKDAAWLEAMGVHGRRPGRRSTTPARRCGATSC